jgi:hypothetical protein
MQLSSAALLVASASRGDIPFIVHSSYCKRSATAANLHAASTIRASVAMLVVPQVCRAIAPISYRSRSQYQTRLGSILRSYHQHLTSFSSQRQKNEAGWTVYTRSSRCSAAAFSHLVGSSK